MQAELQATSSAGQEIIWLRRLLEQLGCKQPEPTMLYNDNQAAIANINGQHHSHGPAKHIDLRYHFMREQHVRKRIKVSYLQSDKMPADILTKAVPEITLERAATQIGMTALPDSAGKEECQIRYAGTDPASIAGTEEAHWAQTCEAATRQSDSMTRGPMA
jgi:hypothetical protein